MPSRVAVVKRARLRSFALLRAIPAWISSIWAALRQEPPAPLPLETLDRFPSAVVPALRFSSAGQHACSGCNLCIAICPSEVLHLESASSFERGVPADLVRFTLDLGGCIGCGDCARDCPEEALSMQSAPAVAVAYADGQPEPLYLFDPRKAGS